MSDTLDPLSESADQATESTEGVLVVMHHVDLSMVGLVHRLGEATVTLGRDEPFFQNASGASPLADPCLSRQQVRLTACGALGFSVEPLPSARRPTRALSLDGHELPLPGVVPATTLLQIGDRVLLSQDRGWYDVGTPGGGTPRPYTHLTETFLPGLRAAGVDDPTIGRLTRDNPFAAFAR